jgi:hypothetical protein
MLFFCQTGKFLLFIKFLKKLKKFERKFNLPAYYLLNANDDIEETGAGFRNGKHKFLTGKQ